MNINFDNLKKSKNKKQFTRRLLRNLKYNSNSSYNFYMFKLTSNYKIIQGLNGDENTIIEGSGSSNREYPPKNEGTVLKYNYTTSNNSDNSDSPYSTKLYLSVATNNEGEYGYSTIHNSTHHFYHDHSEITSNNNTQPLISTDETNGNKTTCMIYSDSLYIINW